MQIQPEEKPEWAEGKHCHDLMQDHVSGKKLHPHLKHIKYKFPIVEQVAFDPRCKFELIFRVDGEDYKIIGFYDGRNLDFTKLLEGKFSFKPWSLSQFQKSMQRKVYAWSNPEFEEAILITGQRKPELWKDDPPKVYKVPMTRQDRGEAEIWMREGIYILRKGDFTSDLVDGKCVDRWCYWGANCQFK